MRIQARAPRPVFYACPCDTPVRADRWFYQTGNMWCAVAPGESAAEWFEDKFTPRAEWPAVREYPITVMPPSGVLRYRRRNGEDAEYVIPPLWLRGQTEAAPAAVGPVMTFYSCRPEYAARNGERVSVKAGPWGSYSGLVAYAVTFSDGLTMNAWAEELNVIPEDGPVIKGGA